MHWKEKEEKSRVLGSWTEYIYINNTGRVVARFNDYRYPRPEIFWPMSETPFAVNSSGFLGYYDSVDSAKRAVEKYVENHGLQNF